MSGSISLLTYLLTSYYLLLTTDLLTTYYRHWYFESIDLLTYLLTYCILLTTYYVLLTTYHSYYRYWYFESIDLVRKLLNTAVVAAVWQGSELQLTFSALAAALSLFAYTLLQPYKDALGNRVQLLALLHLLSTHLSTPLFINDAYTGQNAGEAMVGFLMCSVRRQ